MFLQEEELRCRLRYWRVHVGVRSPFAITILFIPASAPLDKLAMDWAEDCDQIILRLCPICKRDLIVGHGRRRKQAHDEHHDWIGIRRGRCAGCGTTFTFLPLFSLPYTHFSLLARCQAVAAALCGALFMGKDGAQVQGRGSRARLFDCASLV
jgi:hypothetical protein